MVGGVLVPDYIPSPTVRTYFKIGGFVLCVCAYLHISKSEGRIALEMYKRQHHLSFLPKHGYGKVFANFGNNPTDSI